MKQLFFLTIFCLFSWLPQALAQPTQQVYLSGTDKDHTLAWDFFCTKGRNSGKWTKIAVPSQWEQQGFGSYNYGHDREKTDEEGLYKHTFTTQKDWKEKRVFIAFEGAMTDTEVKINGKLAGPVHQGGFYRFSYEITKLLKPEAENLLEVKVSKQSADASINKAERSGDFWVLSGIFRPVYLEIVPQTYIERVAIDAKADGSFLMDVYAPAITTKHRITAQIQELNGNKVGEAFSAKADPKAGKTTLKHSVSNPRLWNAEFPNLYQVVVSVTDAQGSIHTHTQKFGFRTIELRPQDGIYVNGQKVIFKGVCRHSFWPETGRTLSKEISILDVNLMKEMNMNAVRMSHYPPDQHFLDVCDSLGLFVLDELTGWQAKYDTEVGRKLVKELVVRDVNHPSILFWDNGNEGGWNTGLDGDYMLYDPQKRLVLHPWEKFNGTDTRHYISYNYLVNSTLSAQEILMPTEFMHGLYDGGHAAGLDDFWNLMLKHPYCAGGFLWSFHDEGIVRTDKNGKIDTDGNHAPDGLVGPYREKEASFYAVKEIWSPVAIDRRNLPTTFDGKLEVENRYSFTNLDQCTFTWKLVTYPTPTDTALSPIMQTTGKPKALSLAPGNKGWLDLNLPANWKESDALYLTATDPYNRELFTWTWAIHSPADIARRTQTVRRPTKTAIKPLVQGNSLTLTVDGVTYSFSQQTGNLEKVTNTRSTIPLSNGPVQAGVNHTLKQLTHRAAGESYIVEPLYEGRSDLGVKWTFTPGQPAKLEYSYSQRKDTSFMGITFQYPEEKITGMKWLGRGPYRVWKNRLKGMQLGVWHKAYNNTITGESWQYPEFKGYHSELYWVVIETKEAPFTIYTADKGVYLQMLKPAHPAGANNANTSPAFPEGNISFLQAISPIGTKFQPAEVMGPQSQKNMMLNYTPVSGTLWFDFR